jgi:serine/threonine-protein kinase
MTTLPSHHPWGSLLDERYALTQPLGRGGMGEVWAGTDLLLHRTVAIKVMHEHLAVDATARDRFEREARAVASLNHPCIAAVYDAVSLPLIPSRPYMVMEFVAGDTLADQLQLGLPSMSEALGWADGILAALECAHAAGVVHRDIKPANVMVTNAGLVKVMDFGIAHVTGSEHSTLTSSTHTVVGTAAYMAPEQAQGHVVDARSDLYSVGCLLYELLTGRPPYLGDTPLEVMYQHVHEEPVPPSLRALDVPAQLDALVLRALAKDPADRFSSATQMHEALVFSDMDADVDTDPDAEDEPDTASHARPNRRRGALWLTAGLTFALTALVAIMLLARQPGVGSSGDPPTSTPANPSLTVSASSLTFPSTATMSSASAVPTTSSERASPSASPTPSAEASSAAPPATTASAQPTLTTVTPSASTSAAATNTPSAAPSTPSASPSPSKVTLPPLPSSRNATRQPPT